METTLKTIAELMAVAARTAPKTKGEDYISIRVLAGGEVGRLADLMEKYGADSGRQNYDRDAAGVRDSGAVLLLSLDAPAAAGINCGACGYDKCVELNPPRGGVEFAGPICAWRLIDLGIALGSAAKTAAMLNADNRIMYRIGAVARKEGLLAGDLVIGIPLSASGKNVFFDR